MAPSSSDLQVLHEVFTPDVIEAMLEKSKSDKGFELLHQTLTAQTDYLAFRRAHLDKCLRFAKAHDGLDKDRVQRLRNPRDYAAWRAVYNELLVPYFLAKRFNLKICFTVNPTAKGQGDFQIVSAKEPIVVEVKTPKGDDPQLQGPKDTLHAGWDEGLIKPSFIDAAGQLVRGNYNLVVICTGLCAWIRTNHPFEKLLYGQDIITATFDADLGRMGDPEVQFRPDGEFPRHKPKRHTRVSAVASFRTDTYWGGAFDSTVMQVQFAVLHNYFARCPITPGVFAGAFQYVPDRINAKMRKMNRRNSSLYLYMGETKMEDACIRLRVCARRLLRRLRSVYYRVRMRRVHKRMRAELRDRLTEEDPPLSD